MKRLWFAVIILIVCTVMCAGEQIYLKNVYTNLCAKTDAAYVNTDYEHIEEIKEYWNSSYPLMSAVFEHDIITDISVDINSLNPDDSEIKKDLTEIKNCGKVFYDNEKLSFSNIF